MIGMFNLKKSGARLSEKPKVREQSSNLNSTGNAAEIDCISPAVELNSFTFAYPNSANVLEGATLKLAQGEFCVLVGKCGSGKTTLLKHLVPALVPAGVSSGNIRVFGMQPKAISSKQAAKLVGYVNQNVRSQFVCSTVLDELAFTLENLGVAPSEMRLRLAEACQFFGVEQHLHSQVHELSGGTVQLVALASAAAPVPKMLVLDEPTAALNPIAKEQMFHELFRINRQLGITVVVATHAPEAIAKYATCAFKLSAGKLECCSLNNFNASKLSPAEIEQLQVHQQLNGASENAPSKPVVRLSNVYARYGRQNRWILHGLDLSVLSGTIHGILGSNGCGKTTLLNVVAGVMKNTSGNVKNELRNSQALLCQNPSDLFVCDTVSDELNEWKQTCGYSAQDVKNIAEEFGLASSLNMHPYDLSGGQQVLLAIAKLVLSKPKLLLLDEPVRGIDAASKQRVANCLLNLASSGTAIIVVTHDIEFAACVCSHITLLFDGQNALTCAPAEFFQKTHFYRPRKNEFVQGMLKSSPIPPIL